MSQNLLFNPKPLTYSLEQSSQYKIPQSKTYQDDIMNQYKPARSSSNLVNNSQLSSFENEPKKTMIHLMIK